MAETNNSVQLVDPENNEVLWFPITLASLVNMPDGTSLVAELAKYMPINTFTEVINNVRYFKAAYIPDLPKYLKQGSYSVTTAPYVAEVSVNQDGDELTVKTWSKEANGVIKTETIPIVGDNTTYSLSAKYNTETTAGEAPNSAVRLTDSNGISNDAVVPTGALRNDNGVTLILDGNFNDPS